MKMIHAPSLTDRFNRRVDYLRISVTDRCNLRCRYCVPCTPFKHLKKSEILSWDEIFRIVETGTRLGISKIRLTGGEPLYRKGIVDFVSRLCSMNSLKDVAVTTNGVFVSEKAEQLKHSGLKRINISLDTLQRSKFKDLTGSDLFSKTWEGIMTAYNLGFSPIKINTVVIKGFNENEIEQLARLSLQYPFHIRFIEYMPVGANPHQNRKFFFPASEIRKKLEKIGNLIPVEKQLRDGPAERLRFEGAPGEIGLIGSMSHCFCNTCNRLRLTASGNLRPCLLADDHVDILPAIRGGASDEDIETLFLKAIAMKDREHHMSFDQNRTLQTKMVSIGG